MKILIACEESQRITEQFVIRGFDCYSCDIKQTSGSYPERHIVGDAIRESYSGKYDMMIAHPPCQYMSCAGAHLMHPNGQINQERLHKGLQAKEFFLKLLNAPIEHIAIENPTPLSIVGLPPHSQVIQPWQFGDPYTKRTLLWLKNLPPLKPTNYVQPTASWTDIKHTKTDRSKTFRGIAIAIAEQWQKPTNYQMHIKWVQQ